MTTISRHSTTWRIPMTHNLLPTIKTAVAAATVTMTTTTTQEKANDNFKSRFRSGYSKSQLTRTNNLPMYLLSICRSPFGSQAGTDRVTIPATSDCMLFMTF